MGRSGRACGACPFCQLVGLGGEERSLTHGAEVARPRSGLFARRAVIQVIVVENAVRGAFQIVELARFQRPKERRKPRASHEQRRGNEPSERRHGFNLSFIVRSLNAFAVTRIDDVDMAIAATRGVTSPAMASGTKSRLYPKAIAKF